MEDFTVGWLENELENYPDEAKCTIGGSNGEGLGICIGVPLHLLKSFIYLPKYAQVLDEEYLNMPDDKPKFKCSVISTPILKKDGKIYVALEMERNEWYKLRNHLI